MSDNPIYRRTVVKREVPSRILPEGHRDIRVYLPPGYQETVSYPVVYCQDGEEFFNFGRIATIAQRLILEEDWEPFVVVGVDVDKKMRTSEYQPGESRHDVYTRFFAEELLLEVEKQFSVRRTPDQRVLAGDSLGASVCMSLVLRYQNLFTRLLSLSGAYYEVVQKQLAAFEDLSWLSVWMTVGLQETDFTTTDRGTFDFVQLNRDTRQLLDARNARIAYSEKDGEHKWGFWQSQLPDALSAFLGPSPIF